MNMNVNEGSGGPAVGTKELIWRIVAVLLAIFWMMVIFAYSAKTAEASTKQSLRLGRALGRLVMSDWNELSDEEQLAFAERWDHPERKAGHVAEFAILGFLLTNVFIARRTKKRPTVVLSLFSGIVYAASDELHQTFVPGRAGMITDVGIDACGVAIGTAVFLGIYVLIIRIKERAEGRKEHRTEKG